LKKNNFLDKEIKALDDKIKSLIYIELITKYIDEEYKEQKHHIYDIYLSPIDTKEGQDNIIKLVKELSGDDQTYFLYEKLLEKCQFTKDDYFSSRENYKIKLLYRLNEELRKESGKGEKDGDKADKNSKKYEEKLNRNEKAAQGNDYVINIVNILDEVKKDLKNERIFKKDLEKFLNIKKTTKVQKDNEKFTRQSEESNKNSTEKVNTTVNQEGTNEEDNNNKEVNEKLGLITLVLEKYNPITKYAEYISNIVNINKTVEKLIDIKDSLMIFHKNLYIKDIQKITEVIDEIAISALWIPWTYRN
jgi:hypothetical protein